MTNDIGDEANTYQQRRSVPRFPFVAVAEISETNSEIKLSARVSELSLHGCYIDMLNPLPRSTDVLVKIFTETEFFEAYASVIYSHPNLGVGLVFREVKPHFLQILQGWLLKAMKQAQRPGN